MSSSLAKGNSTDSEDIVDFTDTGAFSKAVIDRDVHLVEDPENGTQITFNTILLKKSKIYRAGTKRMEDRRDGGLGFPLFFSDEKNAITYVNSGASGTKRPIRQYKTTKELRLMEFTMENIIKLVYLSKKKGKVGIESYLLKTNPSKNYDAIFAITEDADYETNNPGVLEEFKYMNRTIAQCVCEIGLDGWIAMPENDVKQRVFNPQITIAVNTLISQINKNKT